MSDLPERIWACMGGPMVGMFVSGGNNGGWPEYVRADIVPHVNETPKSEHDIANMLTLTAERDRLRYERDAILLDGTIHSDQREKYERLCARIAAGKASQQDAVDAIRQLCRDNERLALRRSDARAALKGESHD